MVKVQTEITINRSIDKVSEYAINPDNAPHWYVNIHSAQWQTPKPLTLGSKIAFKAKFLNRDLAYVYEIVEFIPGEKMVMKTAQGPFPMETTYEFYELEPNLTKMTLRNSGVPTGFSKVFAPFMSTMMKKANMKDLKKIKEILES
ncbi:SRPBCC family protein [Bacillus suaedaesalsae]|uniref:SRPBCC family protein n=1 Tax=Bacillus suaedaesalsae TaxID=2810349 RepID=A0ABS2DIS9_9BACI|nr:SRPBCC family protein [Bacillus suaedaesalsae]MBM6617895.1 SRPBCC family protein [Bacillus suaedaesalsae]